MFGVKNSRIFVLAAILYAVFISYLSITADIINIKHVVNTILIRGTRATLVASKITSALKGLVYPLNFVKSQSIDIGHVGIYFGFGFFLYFAFVSLDNRLLQKYSAVFAICIGTAYGILNELFQIYLPYRNANIADALSNLLGLVLSQILVIIFIFVFRHILDKKERILDQ
jgi:VanZ family protein